MNGSVARSDNGFAEDITEVGAIQEIECRRGRAAG
jgi:hypothetical protein